MNYVWIVLFVFGIIHVQKSFDLSQYDFCYKKSVGQRF